MFFLCACECACVLFKFLKVVILPLPCTLLQLCNVWKVLLKMFPTTLVGFLKDHKRRYLSPFTILTIFDYFPWIPSDFLVSHFQLNGNFTQFLSLLSFLSSSLNEHCYTFQKEPNGSLWDLLHQMENKLLSLVCQPWVSMPLEATHNRSVCWGSINLWKPPE